MASERVDALVIFGATGDLAKLETFPALVGLVDRGVLDVPVVGVAKSGWGLEQFREYAAASLRAQRPRPGLRAAAEDARPAALRRRRPGRRRHLRRHVAGDGRREAGPVLPRGAAVPVRPDRPGHRDRRPRRRCPGDGGEAVRQRPGQRPGAERHHARVLPRGRGLPRRPLAGAGPARGRAGRPVRQLDLRAAAQPRPRGEHPDHHGRGLRRRRPRPLLRPRPAPIRDVVQNHMLQVLATVLADPPDGSRPRLLAGRQGSGHRRAPAADPGGHRPRPVRGLPRRRRASPPARRRRPSSRCGSALDSWRWAGVPIADPGGQAHAGHRDRGHHPVPPAAARRVRRWARSASATSCASGSGRRPRSGSAWPARSPARAGRPQLQELVVRPAAGRRTCGPTTGSSAPRWTASGCCSPGRTPSRRPGGSSTRSSATSCRCTPTPRGSWGPTEADPLLPDGDTWHDPAG